MKEPRRLTIALPEAEYKALKELARKTGKTMGAIVREALKQTVFAPRPDKSRMRAVRELASLSVPVGDWEEIEREIEEGFTGVARAREAET